MNVSEKLLNLFERRIYRIIRIFHPILFILVFGLITFLQSTFAGGYIEVNEAYGKTLMIVLLIGLPLTFISEILIRLKKLMESKKMIFLNSILLVVELISILLIWKIPKNIITFFLYVLLYVVSVAFIVIVFYENAVKLRGTNTFLDGFVSLFDMEIKKESFGTFITNVKSDKNMQKKAIGISLSVVAIFVLISVLAPSGNPNSTRSNPSIARNERSISPSGVSSTVPRNVEATVKQTLGIDSSQGGEIISISGQKVEDYADGSELWSVSVKYKLCSSCSTDSISTKVQVK